ncbi:MAG: UbiD family decarboxylase [Chloroflexi bacterium]|nr:UbiD family decarboxylase [Chloroflexota bacterium]
MRTWIGQLEAAGQLRSVSRSVHPHREIAALIHQSKEKSLLFKNLDGYPGWRGLAQAPANPRQLALAFDTTLDKLVPGLAGGIHRQLPCEIVNSGPVKDIVLKGDDVDITRLPAHQAGVADAGPYITAGLCVTKDPETGVRNVAFHRLQVKGKNRTGIMMVPRHTFQNYRWFEARGEAMPIAIFIGHHPAYYIAAATTGPREMDELELAGSMMGEPVKLVKCETADLEVPCDAEIVLEGHVPPHYREEEGPFAEFQEYYVAGAGQNPVVEFSCITMRRDPIYKYIQDGTGMEGNIYSKIPMAAAIYNRIKDIGGRVELKNVMTLPGIFGVVVQMTPRFYGEAKTVLMSVLSSEYLHPKIAIAVDEDVDIFNHSDLWWAVNTRVDPAKDIVVLPGMRIIPMDPTGEEYAQTGQPEWHRTGGKMIIDATRPPTCNPKARATFERTRPVGLGQVLLEKYLD